jgi:hypothetical protein
MYYISLSNIIGEVGILNLPLLLIAMKEYIKTRLEFVGLESRVDIGCQDDTSHNSTQSVILGRKIITLCSENL